VKKRSTRAVHSLRLFTCSHISCRAKLVSLVRGPHEAESAAPRSRYLCCGCAISLYRTRFCTFSDLRDVEQIGEGTDTAEGGYKMD
jgi:hypothetical protein